MKYNNCNTETGAAGLIIFYIFFRNIIILAISIPKKVPDFSKFSFVFELQPLQDRIYLLI